MPDVHVPEEALRQMLQEAVARALEERHDLLREVVAEVLEEVALAEAVREGRRTEPASRDEVFAALGGGA